MKDFFKYTLATITGLVITGVILGIITVISIVGMVASSESAAQVEDNSVMVLSLKGNLQERTQNDIVTKISGTGIDNLGLDDVLCAIDKAKANDKIKGIYIEAGLFAADTPASAQAIRDKLDEFKKSGKWIVAYADQYTQMTYYICSVANQVFLNPQGMIDWHGLAAQPYFLKDLLAKFGVKVQLAKVGKYKSMPETLTADGMSEPNREQVTVYLSGIWDEMLTDVAASRKISKESLNAYADNFVTLADPKQYLSLKLVDKLLYTDEVKGEIKKLLKQDTDDVVNQISANDMLNVPDTQKNNGEEIAVYYAYGEVVDAAPTSLSESAVIAADIVCKDIEKLTNDDNVKAVVLRINSGGGSAYASEQIWHQITKLKAKKPVVVSMGGMAASGAYYISSPANYIFAEPTTLTGSIGIFGMFPDLSGLLTDKLGIKFDEVKTNKFSAFGTPARPFNADEMAYLNAYIDRGYKLFRQRVSEGRKLTTDAVENIAQGRVWLGRDALRIKLVDQLGGLDDAIKKAAQLAKLKEYHTNTYPGMPDWTEQLFATTSGNNYLDEQLHATLGEYYAPFMYVKNINKRNAIQARIPYQLIIK